jgi:hypothetical protein
LIWSDDRGHHSLTSVLARPSVLKKCSYFAGTHLLGFNRAVRPANQQILSRAVNTEAAMGDEASERWFVKKSKHFSLVGPPH